MINLVNLLSFDWSLFFFGLFSSFSSWSSFAPLMASEPSFSVATSSFFFGWFESFGSWCPGSRLHFLLSDSQLAFDEVDAVVVERVVVVSPI